MTNTRVRLALVLAAFVGCGGGEDVTPQAIARARRTWEQAKVRDYNLDWASSGLMNGHYRVFVRGGEVKLIYLVQPNGREYEVHPAKPELYGVDGLLQVIEDELAQLQSPTPFNQPKGTKAVLRFTTDPKLGYPRTYRRDVLGTPRGVAIDVNRLDLNPPEDLPAPSA
jgi:hypothetical protein